VNNKCHLEEVAASAEALADQEKCTRRSVLTVETNAKFHSSPLKASLYTAENAIRNTRNTEVG
jgi:hypothetical protein